MKGIDVKVPNHKIIAEIEAMHKDGTISEKLYHKLLLQMAADYMQDLDISECQVVLNRIPLEYYETTLFDHMKEDFPFASSVLEMCYRLVQSGIFEEIPTIRQEAEA